MAVWALVRRATSRPRVTAGLRWPPEIRIVAVIMVPRIRPCASATPRTPKSDLGKNPLMIDPAPMNTRAKVPTASAVQRRSREDIARLSMEVGGKPAANLDGQAGRG